MKMQKTPKIGKVKNRGSKARKERTYKTENTIWAVIGIIVVSFVLALYGKYLWNSLRFEKTLKQYVGKAVPNDIVCMFSNKIISDTPDTVTVNGEIYRGCCSDCTNALKYNSENSRYAIDPYSGHSVDKAKAFLTTMDGLGNIVYFETANNLHHYVLNNHNGNIIH